MERAKISATFNSSAMAIFVVVDCFTIALSKFFSFFLRNGGDNIKPAILQINPEETENYNKALLLDLDGDAARKPSVARRCRCSASCLG
jgi:hypothetical protein